MSRLRKLVASCCWRFGCASLSCLNIALTLLALAQAGIILLNSLQQVIPLPNQAIRQSLQQVLGKGYEIDWKSLAFDLKGGLFLREFSLRDPGREKAFMTTRALQVDFALIHLLLGLEPPIESLRALDITLSLPPEKTRSGLHEPVLTIPETALRFDKSSLTVEYLFLDSRNLQLIASGSAPLDPITSRDRPETGSLDLPSLLDALHGLPPDLTLLGRLHARMDHSGNLSARARFSAPRASHAGFIFNRLLASATFTFQDAVPALTSLSLEGQIEALGSSPALPDLQNVDLNLPIPFSLSASGPLSPSPSLHYPQRIQVGLSRPLQSPLPIRSLNLSSNLSRKPLHLLWNAVGPRSFAAGSLTRDPEADTPFPFSLRFRASFHEPSLRAFFPNLPHNPLLKRAQASFLSLDASFLPRSNTLSGLLLADFLHIGRTDFDHLHTRFRLNPSEIHLNPVLVRKSFNESASGSYSQHFPSSRFSLNAFGSIFPGSLDALLGQWWERIFLPVHTPDPLQGDVSVWGQWPDRDSLQSVTAVSGSGASYRGMAIPDLRLKIRSNREWAYLDELNARFLDGRVSGRLGWRLGLGKGQLRPMIVDFKSDGPWKAVVAASGVEALSRLEFSGQPRVRARGTLWRSPRETPSGESLLFPDLTFEISDREDECHLKSLVLSDFRFAGTLLGSDLKLDSLSGDFAGGVFTGRMALRDWNRPAMREQQLTLQLFDADYQTALRQLAGLLREPDRLEDALLHGDTRGRLDAAVDMSFGSDLDEAEGSGQITLRRANISRIHLFGGLSRLLDDIGLGFSTVNLNAASIQWRLADNRLGIKEGLVTGPVVSLRAEGEINLKSRLLNLDADLMLLQGLISKVLTPVSDTIELKVTGPIEEPVWRMNLTPLRWFQNRLSSDSRNNNER